MIRLCARLGQGAEIIPLKIWAYTGKFHPEDGILLGYSADEVLALTGIKIMEGHSADSVIKALQDCGFIALIPNGWRVHQWLEYQGHIAAYSIRGKDAANKRWAKMRGKGQNHATSIPQALLNTTPSNAPTDLTDLTDRSKSKEEKSKRDPLPRFQPPTVSDISVYCTERGNGIDPEKFFAYYESNGWKVGRNPMKSWKAAITTWEKTKNGSNQKSSQYPTAQQRKDQRLREVLAEYSGPKGGVEERDHIAVSIVPEGNPSLGHSGRGG